MFGLFGKKKEKQDESPLVDLHNNMLRVGDRVKSLRYDMGVSILKKGVEGFYYVSESSGQEVHYSRMVDAVTGRQKVEKIEDN